MKHKLLFSLLALFSMTAHAGCTINTLYSTDVGKIFKNHGGFDFPGTKLTNEKFNAICEKLRKASARVQVEANAVVLSNRSIGWAVLSLKDRDTNVATSDYSQINTSVNDSASQNIAEQRMVFSINEALSDWAEIDKAIMALDAERKRARAVLGKR